MSNDRTLLYEGYHGNLTVFTQLVRRCGFTTEEAAEYLMVSAETVRRWARTGKPNAMAVRLLAIRAGWLPWDNWYKWEMHEGYLFPPGFNRHGILPGHILGMPYSLSLVNRYSDRIKELEAELAQFRNRPRAKVVKLRLATEEK